MESAQFRELLIVAKEFGVSFFKAGDVEVHFAIDYSSTKGPTLFPDLKDSPDPDEEFLKKLNDMKNQALA